MNILNGPFISFTFIFINTVILMLYIFFGIDPASPHDSDIFWFNYYYSQEILKFKFVLNFSFFDPIVASGLLFLNYV